MALDDRPVIPVAGPSITSIIPRIQQPIIIDGQGQQGYDAEGPGAPITSIIPRMQQPIVIEDEGPRGYDPGPITSIIPRIVDQPSVSNQRPIVTLEPDPGPITSIIPTVPNPAGQPIAQPGNPENPNNPGNPIGNPFDTLAGLYASMFGGATGGGGGSAPQVIVQPVESGGQDASGPNWALWGVVLALVTLAYVWWRHHKAKGTATP
jgi:hypothetical protein